MCGIVGIVGNKEVDQRLVGALQKLEYRGYDSAGIAVLSKNGFKITKFAGKVAVLKNAIDSEPNNGNLGIGHTRWATHGAPETRNAHPFKTENAAIVHNGIIENYAEIKEELKKHGYSFESDTDTEVILKFVDHQLSKGQSKDQIIQQVFTKLDGAYAFVMIFKDEPNSLYGIRKGAPLAVGVGEGEMYLGSDALALSDLSNRIIYLQDGEYAKISNDNYTIKNSSGLEQKRAPKNVDFDSNSGSKGSHKHFMIKEIYEQPELILNSLRNNFNQEKAEFKFSEQGLNLAKYSRFYIIACGTSYNAAHVAKYWFEKFAKTPVEIDVASEFRYREPVLEKNSLALFISQSGETADTLAALKLAKQQGLEIASIVNVVESTIAHESNYVLPINAGFEIGVASTKAYTAQLMVLAQLVLDAALKKNLISKAELGKYVQEFMNLPEHIRSLINIEEEIQKISNSINQAKSMIYVGRGTMYGTSIEGALKMKELSYIHSEGLAAGELKHGSIALIDSDLPVIVSCPNDDMFAKTVSNVQEIKARSGNLIVVTSKSGLKELSSLATTVIEVPETNSFTAPILHVVPLQLLSYHVADSLGKDVDQPRNLAKSVTVE